MTAGRPAWRVSNSETALAPTSTSMVAATMFAFLVAMLGGSSRYDMLQVPVLIPVACLLAGYFLYQSWDDNWRALNVPLILLLSWTGLTLLQLVPLPPALWHALPGRAPMVEIARLIGDERWRPISMVPWRTEHALWSLSVPLTALLLFAALRQRAVRFAVQAIIIIALASALLGVLQITLPPDNPLYLYSITNPGAPVGLFANSNHASMLSAMVIVVIAATMKLAPDNSPAWQTPVLGGAIFILLVTQFVNGSRAGLGITMVALSVCALIALQGSRKPMTMSFGGRVIRLPASRQSWLALILIGGSLALVGVFYYFDRLLVVEELVGKNPLEDSRFQLAPILRDMTLTYFPFGSGFGSFEKVYLIHEPVELLSPDYLNQAHNDIMQVPIEGGIVAVAIAFALFAWLGIMVRRAFVSSPAQRVLAFAVMGAVACLLLSSGVDYPLRTPIFQIVTVWLVAILARLSVAPPRREPDAEQR